MFAILPGFGSLRVAKSMFHMQTQTTLIHCIQFFRRAILFAYLTGHGKKMRALAKVRAQSRNNWKHCFLFLITLVELAGFIFNV